LRYSSKFFANKKRTTTYILFTKRSYKYWTYVSLPYLLIVVLYSNRLPLSELEEPIGPLPEDNQQRFWWGTSFYHFLYHVVNKKLYLVNMIWYVENCEKFKSYQKDCRRSNWYSNTGIPVSCLFGKNSEQDSWDEAD
jgi:hypothetical protein